MPLADAAHWISEHARPDALWFAKRLSANDTGLTGGHQAGPLLPKKILFAMFPKLDQSEPSVTEDFFDLYIDSHADHRKGRAVWYKSKNEGRITNLGGRQSALLDPESTGALAVFAFALNQHGSAKECHVWVCGDGPEVDRFEERIGTVEPKSFVVWSPGQIPQQDLFSGKSTSRNNCYLDESEIPSAWSTRMPTGAEIIRKTLELRPPLELDADGRLVQRRQCEYEIFQSIERAFYLPKIQDGASSVDKFMSLAQTILQSRKSRSGTSLELHVREIMMEEGLRNDIDFAFRPTTEGGKKPDFIFPSQAAYNNLEFPETKLRMLAAKTTCKDRWRQVINEADRIATKHLLTLQEGVSERQFQEMRDAGVQLVVPPKLHTAYPSSVRPHLMTFEGFIGDVRLLSLSGQS